MQSFLEPLVVDEAIAPPPGDIPEPSKGAARLAALLRRYRGGRATVLALPPDGIAVGLDLARLLRLPLGVVVARSFWVPQVPQVPAGALCEGGGLCLNRAVLSLPEVSSQTVWAAIRETRAAVLEDVRRYRGEQLLRWCAHRTVLIVDTELESGLTHLAVTHALRRQHVQRCVAVALHGTPAAARCIAPHAEVALAQME